MIPVTALSHPETAMSPLSDGVLCAHNAPTVSLQIPIEGLYLDTFNLICWLVYFLSGITRRVI